MAGAIYQFETEHGDDLEMKIGNWNPATRQFEETTVMPSSLEVSMTYPNLPFFFARVLGHENFTITRQLDGQVPAARHRGRAGLFGLDERRQHVRRAWARCRRRRSTRAC